MSCMGIREVPIVCSVKGCDRPTSSLLELAKSCWSLEKRGQPIKHSSNQCQDRAGCLSFSVYMHEMIHQDSLNPDSLPSNHHYTTTHYASPLRLDLACLLRSCPRERSLFSNNCFYPTISVLVLQFAQGRQKHAEEIPQRNPAFSSVHACPPHAY